MYVRIKNKPFRFSEERIEEQIRKGSMKPSVMVSLDNKKWITWDVYKNGEPEKPDLNLEADENLQFWENENGKLTIEPKEASFFPLSEPQIWCYSINGMKKEGPITSNEIIDLVKRSVLTKDSIVWKDGKSNSSFVCHHPIFSQYMPDLIQPDSANKVPKEKKWTTRMNDWVNSFKLLFDKKKNNENKTE